MRASTVKPRKAQLRRFIHVEALQGAPPFLALFHDARKSAAVMHCWETSWATKLSKDYQKLAAAGVREEQNENSAERSAENV